MPNTLYDYYKEKGQGLPTIEDRALEFQSLGLGNAQDYVGSAQQNSMLLSRKTGSAPSRSIASVAGVETPQKQQSNPNSIFSIAQNEAPDYSGIVPQQKTQAQSDEEIRAASRNSLQQKIDALNLATTQQKAKLQSLMGSKSPQDLEMEKMGQQLKGQATQKVDEQQILQERLRMMQPYMDIINQQRDEKINDFRNTTAKDNLGSTYSLAAAGGRIGSATGDSEIKGVQRENSRIENEYRTEASLKISALMGQATADAQRQSAERRAAAQQGVDKYLEYLGSQSQRNQTRTSQFIKGMVALGIDPASLTENEFSEIQNTYGLSREQIVLQFNEIRDEQKNAAMQAEAEQRKANTFDLNEGEARYVYDPVTGEAKLVASKAKTYAPTSGSGSSGGYVPGANPSVDSWVGQINAGKATISNVPANLKNAVVQALNSATPTDQSSSYQVGVLKSALENVKKTKGAAGASGVGKFLGDAFIGNTQFRQLEAYIDTVKSNLLALATDPNIKKFFGPQMSNRDVELMTSIASSIDAQRLKPEQIQEEINKIEEFITKYEAAAASNADISGASTEVPTATGYTSASGKTYKLPN